MEVYRRPGDGEDAEAVAIGDLAELIWDPRPLKEAAAEWRSGRDEAEPLLVGETVDGLLTQLGMLLWHEQVERWNRQGLAWTAPEQISDATKWYLTGQRASAKPLVDGFCSRCGEWLYGALNQCALGGNKRSGEPRDEAGNPCGADQQPPFLLRYSPKKLAEEAPAVFEWSEETNCLALRPEFQARPPWKIRSGTRASQKKPWLYCGACHEWLFEDDPRPPVPLRDEDSACRMVPDPKFPAPEEDQVPAPPPETPARGRRKAGHDTAASPPSAGAEPGAAAAAAAAAQETTGTTGDAEAVAPLPEPVAAASYQRKWDEARAWHARPQPDAAFASTNLVPAPRPELWQDAPHGPLHHLKSPEAQGRLAVGQLVSSMEESRVNFGVATYASATGEMNFRRRSAPASARSRK